MAWCYQYVRTKSEAPPEEVEQYMGILDQLLCMSEAQRFAWYYNVDFDDKEYELIEDELIYQDGCELYIRHPTNRSTRIAAIAPPAAMFTEEVAR